MWRNFLLTGVIFLLSCAVFYVTLFDLDPLGDQQIVAYASFYLSIFLGVTSFMTFLFFFAAELFLGKKMGSRQFLRSVRRGIWVALFVVICLSLQYFRMLGILESVLLICFLAALEWVFMGAKESGITD